MKHCRILALGYKGEFIKQYFYNYKFTGADFSLKLDPDEKIEFLTKENLELSKKLKDLALKFLLLEEKLEKYQKESSTEQLSELNDLATVLALVTVGEISAIEPLV